ncbi:Asp-tRNA(Asn)/Glu-tRNA(Gln) amidotransferase subunit GatC [Candidatus Kaiserbacteria bacterium]|nr:Asp-tRNA(Asn)/Glu-tRNA(Gln) amidotransferase subunit GatC [Candidatus Kaiserbacteria bacterium]
MERTDIEHLARLARIKLSEPEKDSLLAELPQILNYVSVVSDIAGEEVDQAPQVGARFNVFRPDEATNEPDEYTKDILAEMPQTDGRFMKVKKIISQDE